MYGTNLPLPSAYRAPVNFRWLWWIGPPAVITWLYRCIPPAVRSHWCKPGNSTSHIVLAEILTGLGWRAFLLGAIPVWRNEVGGWSHGDENRELPDWFPTTGMFKGDGYPANPPPSLDWRAGNKPK